MEFHRFITHFPKVFLTSLKKEPADFSNCTIICCGLGKTAKVYYSHLEIQCMDFLPALIFLPRNLGECMHKIVQKYNWDQTTRVGEPLHKPYACKCVPPQTVWFLRCFGVKTGTDCAHFGLVFVRAVI